MDNPYPVHSDFKEKLPLVHCEPRRGSFLRNGMSEDHTISIHDSLFNYESQERKTYLAALPGRPGSGEAEMDSPLLVNYTPQEPSSHYPWVTEQLYSHAHHPLDTRVPFCFQQNDAQSFTTAAGPQMDLDQFLMETNQLAGHQAPGEVLYRIWSPDGDGENQKRQGLKDLSSQPPDGDGENQKRQGLNDLFSQLLDDGENQKHQGLKDLSSQPPDGDGENQKRQGLKDLFSQPPDGDGENQKRQGLKDLSSQPPDGDGENQKHQALGEMSYQIWSLDRGNYETRGRHAPTEIAYWIWTSPGEDQSDPPQETSNLTLTPPGDHYNCWSTDSNNNHWPVATRREEREELDFNQFCGDAVAVPGSSEFGYDRIWRTTCTGVYHEDISLDNRSSRLYDGRLQGSVVELVANQTAREYRCSHCKDGFRSISNRRRHEISVHGGAISCPYCQKPIGRRADYRKKHARACKAFPRGVF